MKSIEEIKEIYQSGFEQGVMSLEHSDIEWLIDGAHRQDELISIALWSIRRMSNQRMKQYAHRELKNAVGNEHKYSEFIDECLDEVGMLPEETKEHLKTQFKKTQESNENKEIVSFRDSNIHIDKRVIKEWRSNR